MKVHIFISGRGYDTTSELPDELDLDENATVQTALEAIAALLGEKPLASPSAMLAVSGKHLGTLSNHTSIALRDGDEIAIIAPVAGG